LKHKQERDQKITTKMRQIDKTAFIDEFSQDVLLGNYKIINTYFILT